jgi:uncharacterized cupredoxin-like copper-binding protein
MKKLLVLLFAIASISVFAQGKKELEIQNLYDKVVIVNTSDKNVDIKIKESKVITKKAERPMFKNKAQISAADNKIEIHTGTTKKFTYHFPILFSYSVAKHYDVKSLDIVDDNTFRLKPGMSFELEYRYSQKTKFVVVYEVDGVTKAVSNN